MQSVHEKEYVRAALSHAVCELLPNDGIWYCEVPELAGVWADGATKADCLEQLAEVIEGWLHLGAQLGHEAPAIDGLLPTKIIAD